MMEKTMREHMKNRLEEMQILVRNRPCQNR